VQASLRLGDALVPALEGGDLTVTGVVAGLPQAGPNGLSFRFALDAESRRRERAGGAAARRAWQRTAERRPDRAAPRQQGVFLGGPARRCSAVARRDSGRLSQPFRPSVAEVLGPYRERGIRIVDSPECGAWSWPAEVAVDDATCQREAARRSWRAGAAPVAP